MDSLDDVQSQTSGYITIKAIHVWGPFILQLVMLIGGIFSMQQRVDDLDRKITELQAQIVELRAHVWK